MAFTIGRGTNISHWLSQSKARGAQRRAFFTQEDVKRIAGWGLDHLRLPMDEEQMWLAGEVGEQKRDAEAFDLLGSAMDWCVAAGLKVVADLHILRAHHFMDKNPPLYTDEREAQRFAWLWRDMAKFLGGTSTDQLAYELMNEPVAADHADWNRVYKYPYRALREIEPGRTIVLGSNRWSNALEFDTLEIPEGDPALILTFHFYLPMLVTHYKAPWVPQIAQYTGPNQYPGRPIAEAEWAKLPEKMQGELAKDNAPYDAAAMERDIAKPLAAGKRYGYPLYCGEFGVVNYTPDPVRVRWYRDLRAVLAKHKIAWGNWDYKGEFGLVDKEGRTTGVHTGLLG